MATSTGKQLATTAKRPTLREINEGLRDELEMVRNDHERLAEALSNAVMMLRQEDIGWAGGDLGADYRGLGLEELKKWSNDIRASLTGSSDGKKAPNPHMRNGLMLRHSFIWDGGMHYEGIPEKSQGRRSVDELINSGINHRLVFSPPARRRREHALYADGIYLLVGDNRKKTLRPVPLHEITDTYRDPIYEDEIIAYRWTRNEVEFDGRGKVLNDGQRQSKSYWVYVDWYDGVQPSKIIYKGQAEPVLKGHTAFDMHANRPDGQAFGSPDAIAAVVWARIIRDLIMNGVKMQDALAMFAFKATAKNKAGQQTQALELGKAHDAGSAATLAGDADLVPLNSAGKGYDFASIGFVVSTMAASLHVPGIALSANTALAGSSYGAAKTLDLPNRMAMQTRRQEHVEFDKRLLAWLGAKDATPYFNNYDDATDEYRSVQAAYLAWQSGTLSPEGFRNELEIIYGRKFLGPIPTGVLLPNNKKSLPRKDIDTDSASDATPTSTPSPNQGRADGTGGAGHANDLPAAES